MSDAPPVVYYSLIGQHSRNPGLAKSLFSKKGIMIIAGITGTAILTTLLLVFLLPSAKAATQSTSDPKAGSNYTTPPVFPARMFKQFGQLIVSNWNWIRTMGRRICQGKGTGCADDAPGESTIAQLITIKSRSTLQPEQDGNHNSV